MPVNQRLQRQPMWLVKSTHILCDPSVSFLFHLIYAYICYNETGTYIEWADIIT